MTQKKRTPRKKVASHIKNDIINEVEEADAIKGCPRDGWKFWAYDNKQVRENIWKYRAKLMMRMEYLRNQPLCNWHKPEAEKLKKKSRLDPSVFAIRLVVNNVQQRPLGYFRGERYAILVWVVEKGGIYFPKEWMNLVKARKAEVDKNPSKVFDVVEYIEARSKTQNNT